jgi:branched-chain amino acid transport system permease protein
VSLPIGSHLGGLWLGSLLLAATTGLFIMGGSSFYLFIYNSCLLAMIGAVGLNLLMGTAGQVSIGNSAFLAVGAFVSVFVVRSGVPFPLDLVGAAAAGAGVGVVIGLPALRLRGLHLALATLAGYFIVLFFASQYQAHSEGASSGFRLAPLYQSQGLVGGQQYWAATLLVVVLLVLLAASRLSVERSGRAWRMIRDHEVAAHALGVPVTRYKMLAFALSSAVIAFQGALFAHMIGTVSVDQFTLQIAISYVAMVIIGGLDSIAGAVIGAALVTSLPTVVGQLLSGVGPELVATYRPAMAQIIYGLLVVVFITSSPQGLVGLFRRLARNGFVHKLSQRS